MFLIASLMAAACGAADDGGRPVVPPHSAKVSAHPVVLPDPAPVEAQWVLDTLSPTSYCPAPTLSTLMVLDSSGHDRAEVVWLVDNIEVCFASIYGGALMPLQDVRRSRVDELAAEPEPIWLTSEEGAAGAPYLFAVFTGAVGEVTIKGDGFHVFSPVHHRTVDLGDGRFVTFVGFHFLDFNVEVSPDMALCTSEGSCRKLT
ncbi:hypothetical protein [Streptomyces sp. NRRL B-24484]|uniref:hypothetical protein n=1 Tax=Streptomyces sp. NRRL B-24484 TaxID=1463833 RepID=UPI0004BFA94F|nr:hypothetical protein [Streptomyces sp. NRRL B-24484]